MHETVSPAKVATAVLWRSEITDQTKSPLTVDPVTARSSRLMVISGASGFVGRRLALRIAKNHARQVCYVSPNDSEYEIQGKQALSGISKIEADLTRNCPICSEQPSVIFHLAANSATWSKDHSCNDMGSRNFLSSFPKIGPGTHVVFTSSIAVMDTRPDYSQPVSEITPTVRAPLTDYGQSKLRAEEWLKQQARKEGFSLTILRPVTVYGPGVRPNTVLRVLEERVLNRSPITRVPWPGKTGFIHVEDLVSVLLSLGEMPPVSGCTETYLVQSEVLTLAEVCELICAKLEVPYQPFKLSTSSWRMVRSMYVLALKLKNWMPCRSYAAMWRMRIAAENVFWCNTSKLQRALPSWKPVSLRESIGNCLAKR